MGVLQIIMIVLLGMNIGISIVNHGKTETKKTNAGVTLIATLIEVVILWWVDFGIKRSKY